MNLYIYLRQSLADSLCVEADEDSVTYSRPTQYSGFIPDRSNNAARSLEPFTRSSTFHAIETIQSKQAKESKHFA